MENVLQVRLDGPVLGKFPPIGQFDRRLIVADRDRPAGKRRERTVGGGRGGRNAAVSESDTDNVVRPPGKRSAEGEAAATAFCSTLKC
jgi:hypothetical protein